MADATLKKPPTPETFSAKGVFVPSSKGGGGNLINPAKNGRRGPEDIFVPRELIRQNQLKRGSWVEGEATSSPQHPNPKLKRIDRIDGLSPEERRKCPEFGQLTTISPDEWLKVETKDARATNRVVDLFTPIGKGQRGLIVAPPRAGKTTVLKDIAEGIFENHPDTLIIILLVDERPEEVTDFKRELSKAEIYASSNDETIRQHLWIAEVAIDRARRQVEVGKDVILFMDSLTRLARAHNAGRKGSGRTMSGGLDSRALEKPRQLFSSARNTEEAGSLTLIASALVETGSRMDELIFQEFKGTGNMELVLNRKCSELRLYPAIDFNASGTRKEERLLEASVLEKIAFFRRALAPMAPLEACETLLERLGKSSNNKAFLAMLDG